MTPDKKIISIVEFVGLKFSSQSFHLDICLRQIMIINEKPIFNKCLIRINNPTKKISKILDDTEPIIEAEPVSEEAEPVTEEAEPVAEEDEPVLEEAEPVLEEAEQ